MTRILMTGGRAPASLDLARLLAAGGATVFVAESQPWALSSFSAAVSGTFRVRSPRFEQDAFVDDLRRLVQELSIDLVLPTCEEIFWVSRGQDLPAPVEALPRLRRVHDKLAFVQWCEELGLPVPRTVGVVDPAGLELAARSFGGLSNVVVKPAFSRFGTSTLIRPTPAQLATVQPTPLTPWVVQAWIPGLVACTWSWVHRGRVTAYVDYAARHTAGSGSALHFQPLNDPGVRAWVERFASATGWHGHLAFDMVLGADGPVAIECNPRLTSGIHLFSNGLLLTQALLDPDVPMLTPSAPSRAQIAAGMLTYALPAALRGGRFGGWWRDFWAARDVAWNASDPWPFFLQGAAMAGLAWTAWRAGEGLLDASTWDFRWNGENDPTPVAAVPPR